MGITFEVGEVPVEEPATPATAGEGAPAAAVSVAAAFLVSGAARVDTAGAEEEAVVVVAAATAAGAADPSAPSSDGDTDADDFMGARRAGMRAEQGVTRSNHSNRIHKMCTYCTGSTIYLYIPTHNLNPYCIICMYPPVLYW